MDAVNVEQAEARSAHKKAINEANALKEKERKQNQAAAEKLAEAHAAGE